MSYVRPPGQEKEAEALSPVSTVGALVKLTGTCCWCLISVTPEHVLPTAQRICTNRSWFILASNFATNSVHSLTRPPPASALAGSDTKSRRATVS